MWRFLNLKVFLLKKSINWWKNLNVFTFEFSKVTVGVTYRGYSLLYLRINDRSGTMEKRLISDSFKASRWYVTYVFNSFINIFFSATSVRWKHIEHIMIHSKKCASRLASTMKNAKFLNKEKKKWLSLS